MMGCAGSREPLSNRPETPDSRDQPRRPSSSSLVPQLKKGSIHIRKMHAQDTQFIEQRVPISPRFVKQSDSNGHRTSSRGTDQSVLSNKVLNGQLPPLKNSRKSASNSRQWNNLPNFVIGTPDSGLGKRRVQQVIQEPGEESPRVVAHRRHSSVGSISNRSMPTPSPKNSACNAVEEVHLTRQPDLDNSSVSESSTYVVVHRKVKVAWEGNSTKPARKAVRNGHLPRREVHTSVGSSSSGSSCSCTESDEHEHETDKVRSFHTKKPRSTSSSEASRKDIKLPSMRHRSKTMNERKSRRPTNEGVFLAKESKNHKKTSNERRVTFPSIDFAGLIEAENARSAMKRRIRDEITKID